MIKLSNNIAQLQDRRTSITKNWMYHFSNWVHIAYKNQKEKLYIQEGTIISKHYLLKSALKLLQKNVVWEKITRKMKYKHEERLKMKSLASLKLFVILKNADKNKLTTAEAFHEFALKRRVLRSILSN